MKKYIIASAIALASVASFTSCDDFLEEENKHGLTTELYKTQSGMEALVNSCYTTMRFWYGKEGGTSLTELGTDLFLIGGDCKHPGYSLYNSDLNPAQGLMKVYWERFYVGLNNCNTAINLLQSASPLDQETTKSRLGEVQFLRAFYLWHIVNVWGGVHFSTEPSVGVISTANRTSEETFYKQIEQDLNDALANLNGITDKRGGRISQPAVEAFKARVCMYTKKYDEAATLAKKVINSYDFKLFDDYKALWDMSNSEGGTNSEAVFYVNYTTNQLYGLTGMLNDNDGGNEHAFYQNDGGHESHFHFGPRHDFHSGITAFTPQYPIGYSRYATSRHLIELFDERIDQRYAGTFRDAWYQNDGEDGLEKVHSAGLYTEMQLADTAWYIYKHEATDAMRAHAAKKYELQDINDIYNPDGSLKNVQNFIHMNKFDDPTRPAAFQQWSSRDHFVIRIAEMYLIVAEAELQSNPTEALQYMNTLRRTRAIPGHETEMEIAANQLNLDFILEERARELVGEDHRWFDLKRTGKLLEYVRKYNSNGGPNIQEFHLLRPIPQTQIDAVENTDEFVQNPGYK